MTMPTPVADLTDRDDRLARAELGARVKVCGITEPAEIDVLAGQPVDFVGRVVVDEADAHHAFGFQAERFG